MAEPADRTTTLNERGTQGFCQPGALIQALFVLIPPFLIFITWQEPSMVLDTQRPPEPSSSIPEPLPSKPSINQTATVLANHTETGGMKTRIPRVGYVYDTRMMQHTEVRDPSGDEDDYDSENHHPEQPRRIECIDKKLEEAGCLDLMTRLAIRHLRKDEALLVHSEDHWQKVEAIACKSPLKTNAKQP